MISFCWQYCFWLFRGCRLDFCDCIIRGGPWYRYYWLPGRPWTYRRPLEASRAFLQLHPGYFIGWRFPPLLLLGTTLDMGWFGHILAAIYLVWMLNLYNFMDGIDGIAGIEAITVCLGGVLLLFCLGKGLDNERDLGSCRACKCRSGLLIWNFLRQRYSWEMREADSWVSFWGAFRQSSMGGPGAFGVG